MKSGVPYIRKGGYGMSLWASQRKQVPLKSEGGNYLVTGNKFRDHSRKKGGCQKLKWNGVEIKVQSNEENKWEGMEKQLGNKEGINREMNTKYERQEKGN